MHHKRRSRRRDKRTMAPCGCCTVWDGRGNTRQAPVEDGPCTGKPRKKKPTPKKDKCPINRTHEWYKEWETKTESVHFFSRTYTVTRRTHKATCIHCWKEKILKRIVRYA